jgi:hypothetical protein
MIRLTVLLAACALAAPAFAGNDNPTEILRGSSAPPPVEQPAPQPAVVEVPVYYPQPVYYYYPVPVRRPVVIHHHHHSRH